MHRIRSLLTIVAAALLVIAAGDSAASQLATTKAVAAVTAPVMAINHCPISWPFLCRP